jgi:hypothetical protein
LAKVKAAHSAVFQASSLIRPQISAVSCGPEQSGSREAGFSHLLDRFTFAANVGVCAIGTLRERGAPGPSATAEFSSLLVLK